MASTIAEAAGLTAREVDILCAVCLSLKSKPEIDMQKFNTLAGFATSESARTNLSRILKKVMEKRDSDSAPASPEAAKKTSGRKRKAATSDGAEEDGGEETPSKKKKGKKGKKNKGVEEDGMEGDANDGDGETQVKDEVSHDGAGESV